MPELPEVETIAADIAPHVIGRRIEDVTIRWPAHIARPDAELFGQLVKDLTIESVGRRGKFIVFGLSDGSSLLVHLKMTGRLYVKTPGEPLEKHEHTVFHLDDGRELRFHDYRKFGRVHLVETAEEALGGLGPEPLLCSFDAQTLARLLEGRRGRIKSLLLNQSFLAGLGNIYADEALWQAGIHPLRAADSLTSAEIGRLHRGIRGVLRTALRNRGTTFSTYRDGKGRPGANLPRLRVYGREDEPCLRCGTPIQRTLIGSRSSHYCPHCQPRPPASGR